VLQEFIPRPERRSRLIFDLDSTVVTVFGKQDGAEVGYNPRYRGKRSYNPLLCLEANSAFLWDTELRSGNAGTCEASPALLETTFVNVPPEIRDLRFRADAGFGYDPVFKELTRQPSTFDVAVSERYFPVLKIPGTGKNGSSRPDCNSTTRNSVGSDVREALFRIR